MKWLLGIAIVLSCLPAIIMAVARANRNMKGYRMGNHVGRNGDIE